MHLKLALHLHVCSTLVKGTSEQGPEKREHCVRVSSASVEKAKMDYGSRANKVIDIVRASMICQSLDGAAHLMESLVKHESMSIDRIMNGLLSL
jgi:hypothetical protein